MNQDVRITLVNHSKNQDLPKIFMFMHNDNNESTKQDIIWKIISNIPQETSTSFNVSSSFQLKAFFEDDVEQETRPRETPLTSVELGNIYVIGSPLNESLGIHIVQDGYGSEGTIDVTNNILFSGYVDISLCKDGKPVMMCRSRSSEDSSPQFAINDYLFFGFSKDKYIEEGQFLKDVKVEPIEFLAIDLNNPDIIVIIDDDNDGNLKLSAWEGDSYVRNRNLPEVWSGSKELRHRNISTYIQKRMQRL